MVAITPQLAALISLSFSALQAQGVAIPHADNIDIDVAVGDSHPPSGVSVMSGNGRRPTWGLLDFDKKSKLSPNSADAPTEAPLPAKVSKSKASVGKAGSSHKNHSKHVPGKHHRMTHKGKSGKGHSSKKHSGKKHAGKKHSGKKDKRHHHHHHHDIHVHEHIHKRSPRHHHHHHHHGHRSLINIGTPGYRHHNSYNVQGEGAGLVIPGLRIGDGLAIRDHHHHHHHHGHEDVHVHKHVHRRSDTNDVPGTIDMKTIMGSDEPQKVASLVLGTDPTTNSSFVLSATNRTATQVYLHVKPDAPVIPGNPDAKTVSLRIPVFDRSQASTADYCAQFDPHPAKPSALTAEPCLDNSTSPHISQDFAYTPATGLIQPLWTHDASNSTAGNSTAPSKRAENCDEAPTNSFAAMNSTSPSNDTDTNASPTVTPQDVTLFFTPTSVAAEVYAVSDNFQSDDADDTEDDEDDEDEDTMDPSDIDSDSNSNSSMADTALYNSPTPSDSFTSASTSEDVLSSNSTDSATTSNPTSDPSDNPTDSSADEDDPADDDDMTTTSPADDGSDKAIQANAVPTPGALPAPSPTLIPAITITHAPTASVSAVPDAFAVSLDSSSTAAPATTTTSTSDSAQPTSTTSSAPSSLTPAVTGANYEWMFTPDEITSS